ncbi:hypothetical protein [Tunturiibacter gelidoferens]|jgi:hypothetical protein|uniref:Uncharacterized protein n=1 Tax=Tunturiibacter gelidiferens TaxID=3069689 RepID=A0A9X0U611_9BACT|nr:hypothetical protein [Edaphobacter lichenicola]MBB5331089.1 hypothetical protein [Edaphobacter lichenicola]
MADQLYLSLWFPNFRFETLPATMVSVMRQFALISGEKRVVAASVYPISFTEAPTYQRIYVNDDRAEENQDTSGSIIENAVAEATEQLHDDMAYEFEMHWKLWSPEVTSGYPTINPESDPDYDTDPEYESASLDPLWKLQPTTVRILGFGPQFDDASFDQNGHIRIDFGLDTPWLAETLEDEQLDEDATKHIQQNVEMLLAFTLSVEKNCGISSRLLWTESGEPLAQKLIDRLQRVN